MNIFETMIYHVYDCDNNNNDNNSDYGNNNGYETNKDN